MNMSEYDAYSSLSQILAAPAGSFYKKKKKCNKVERLCRGYMIAVFYCLKDINSITDDKTRAAFE